MSGRIAGVDAGADLLELRLGDLLDEMAAADTPLPGGGTAAAIGAAMAAAILTMAARRSVSDWPDARGVAAQAQILRLRATDLAEADAEAYEDVLELLERGGERTAARDFALGRAYSRAADLPLRIAALATDVAELALLVAERGDQRLRPDAAAAAVLAGSAARVGEQLVAVNLATSQDDERLVRARVLAAGAEEAARRTLAVVNEG